MPIFAIFGDKIEQEKANSAKSVFVLTAFGQLWETGITYVWCDSDSQGWPADVGDTLSHFTER